MTVQTLPVPQFFDPTKVDQLWAVPYLERQSQAEQWAAQHQVQRSVQDSFRVCLMLIDEQITFCLPPPNGQLFVAGRSGNGAVEDAVRVCEFIYRNLPYITEIDATMDTNRLMQIFHPYFWVGKDGSHPDPMTVISVADIQGGVWSVNPAIAASVAGNDFMALERHALHYARELEKSGKYPLVVWPYHGMLGGIAHALVPAIEEACFFHAAARGAQTGYEIKGGNFLTENYSVLAPEVTVGADNKPIDQKNARFIKRLLSFDAIIIAGQAASHCVAWSIQDLLNEIDAEDHELAKKVYILEDCTSPVVVKDDQGNLIVDFTAEALAAFDKFSKAGMNLVKSTEPLDSWPGIKL